MKTILRKAPGGGLITSYWFSSIFVGSKSCSYDKPEKGKGRIRTGSYECHAVNATILSDNGVISTSVYRSYPDAKTTDFKCALYECEMSYTIQTFINDLKQKNSSDCYYKKDILKTVYIETEAHSNVEVMLALFIFFIVLGVICVIIICICHKHRPNRKEQETFNMYPVDVNDVKIYQIQSSSAPSGATAANTKKASKERRKTKPQVSVGIFAGRRK